ncbi:MAG: hypothetical protein ACQEP6_03365 [Patescibacteria group bacterium]
MSSNWTWSARRQAIIIGSFMVVVFLIGAVILTRVFLITPEEEPSPEEGYQEPKVFWSKTFQVSGDLHGAVAHFYNFEGNLRSPKAVYRFTFFNKEGEVIKTREGETFFEPGESFYVFENDLYFEEKPEWTTLSWEEVEWEKEERTLEEKGYSVDVADIELADLGSTPRLEARVVNTGSLHIPSVEAVVLIYDEYENTVSASRATLDPIRFDKEARLSLSWPDKFKFLDNSCSPPLETEVVLLDNQGDDASSIRNELETFEENVDKGFSWSFGFFNTSRREAGEIVEAVERRSASMRHRDNPLFVLVYPKEENVSEIEDKLDHYDFVEMLPVSHGDGGYLRANLSSLYEILDRNCVHEPEKVRVHSRVLE